MMKKNKLFSLEQQKRSHAYQNFIQRPSLSLHEERALKQTILRAVIEQLCAEQSYPDPQRSDLKNHTNHILEKL